MKNRYIMIKSITLLCVIAIAGCKDFVLADLPTDQIATKKVYETDDAAISAIRGIYVTMVSSGFASGNSSSVTLLAGRSADDFINQRNDDTYKQFSVNDISPENLGLRSGIWQSAYKIIYASNSVIENLEQSLSVSTSIKDQLFGEAKFIRAFCHFYLTNLFGEVPLILSTDYKSNAAAFPASKEQIYNQMIKDLLEAKNLLPEKYFSDERIRVNKWAATALLARVYLFHQKWSDAERESSEVIGKVNLYKLSIDLNKVFLKNSEEAILQFSVPVASSVNTFEGFSFILQAAPGPTTDVILSTQFLAAFEPGDLRLINWIGSFNSGVNSWKYPFKYKVKTGSIIVSEYSMVLRLAEQYLIRSEARIQLGQIVNGLADLNVLRKRARALPSTEVANPLPDLITDLSKNEALMAVEKERRIELFSEWGHRWLDLKRTERADDVLATLKAQTWQATDVLYPIPAYDLINAKNLVQNKGYEN